MPMIPPAAPAPQQPFPQTGASTSARAGFDPATGQPLPSSAPPAPSALTPEQQRKIDIASGKGLRQEAPPLPHESGQKITLRDDEGGFAPCRRCGVTPCEGISYIFEGQLRFKCDACGNGMLLGRTREATEENRARLEGMDRAETNRKRAWREDDVRRAEETRRQLEQAASVGNPYISALSDRGFVDQHVLS